MHQRAVAKVEVAGDRGMKVFETIAQLLHVTRRRSIPRIEEDVGKQDQSRRKRVEEDDPENNKMVSELVTVLRFPQKVFLRRGG